MVYFNIGEVSMMKQINKTSLLKTAYFLLYPCLIYLCIPYLLYMIYGDGTVYRTQMTFLKMALVSMMNGPLFLLFFYCIPKNKVLVIAHICIACLLLFILPAISFPVQILLFNQLELLAALFGIELLMIHHKLRST